MLYNRVNIHPINIIHIRIGLRYFGICTDIRIGQWFPVYRGADKSLARPDWKNDWKVAIIRPTSMSLLPRRPGWTDKFRIFFFE